MKRLMLYALIIIGFTGCMEWDAIRNYKVKYEVTGGGHQYQVYYEYADETFATETRLYDFVYEFNTACTCCDYVLTIMNIDAGTVTGRIYVDNVFKTEGIITEAGEFLAISIYNVHPGQCGGE